VAIGLGCSIPAQAQESRWAQADDSTARSLINYERLWAESDCTHNSIEKTILAEDFQGTAPDGSRVGSAQIGHEETFGVMESKAECGRSFHTGGIFSKGLELTAKIKRSENSSTICRNLVRQFVELF
jgi:hypothetical protein